MKAFGAAAIISLVGILPVLGSQTTRPRSGVTAIQVPVDLVLIDVSVQDKDGQPVRNLTAEDFRVYEDRIEQHIDSLSAEESPVSWGLVLDRSGSMESVMPQVHAAAVNVLDQGTNDDQMFIMTFNSKQNIVSEITSDRRQLANSVVALKAGGKTALYDSVNAAVDYVRQGEHRRKVLIVVTDGRDNNSLLRFKHLIDRVRESDVLIYAVGMYGSGMNVRSTILARQELKQLAQVTGADTYFPANTEKCREAIDKIALEVREHYTIGYFSSNRTSDGRWRKLKVAVVSPRSAKYSVHARSGYYAPASIASARTGH